MKGPGLPGDWMENKQTLADGVHFFLSYSILLTTWVFAMNSIHLWWWLGGMTAFVAVFVLVKEFWYDLKYETGETVKTSTIDALGWLFGNIFFWIILGVKHWVG